MLDDRVKSGEGVEPWMDTAPAQRLDLYGIAFVHIAQGWGPNPAQDCCITISENRLQNLQKKRWERWVLHALFVMGTWYVDNEKFEVKQVKSKLAGPIATISARQKKKND